jgi:hypothetical protein
LSIIYTCRLNQTNAFHTMTTLSENQERVVANPQQ